MKILLICILLFMSNPASAQLSMTPDGEWVSGEPHITPDGNWVGGEPQITPDGVWIGTGEGGDSDGLRKRKQEARNEGKEKREEVVPRRRGY